MGSRKGAKASAAKEEDELLVAKGSSKTDAASSSSSSEVQLKVNQKFAQAFEERKRKEELSSLEKRGLGALDDDDDESDSETEDEDGEELTRELDADISKTLKLIRKKDPAIYDPAIAFFQKPDSDDEGSDEDTKKSKKKGSVPLYYKDLVRQQAIAGDVSGSEDEDEEAPVQTYAEEQAQIKSDFLKSLKQEGQSSDEEVEQGDDLDGGLFTVRKKSDGEQQQEDEDFAAFTSKYGTKLKKNEVDPDKFLEHYLSSEGWKDKTAVVPHYDEIVKEDEEDFEELEKAEDFEHTYNFRFEEQGGGIIQTHARQIEDTMRREDDTRKRKRAERKARKALERQKKEEQLRRLKNLKQAELEQKLKKVARLMGEDESTVSLKPEDLEGDFDPEEYDKRMQAVFDEQYYDEDDDEMEKPTWDEEEDKEMFAGLPADPEEEEEAENTAKTSDEVEQEEQEQEEEEEEVEQEEEAPKKMTRDEMQREKQKYLDELYSLDYEDLIGDIKCRFKYRQVQDNDFGLTVDEIMAADDKELKQLVSLKRLAPYVDSEYNVDRKRLKNFKKSVREAREENRRRKHKEESTEAQEGEAEQPKKKRKRNKKKKTLEDAEAKPEGVDEAMPEAEADVEEAAKPKSKKARKESAEPAADKSSANQEKKKKRRSKKKKGSEKNSYASTGLPTSRLESYKLVKASKQ